MTEEASEGTGDAQASDGRAIVAQLGAISQSVAAIANAVKDIRQIELNQGKLTREIHNVTAQQTHTLATINNLSAQIDKLTDAQQKSLLIQQQQLEQARIRTLSTEQTALETRRLRQYKEAEIADEDQRRRLLNLWHSLHAGVQQVRQHRDPLVQRTLLAAMLRSVDASGIEVADLRKLDEKRFAEETRRRWMTLPGRCSQTPTRRPACWVIL